MVRGVGRVAEIMSPSPLPLLIKQGWTTCGEDSTTWTPLAPNRLGGSRSSPRLLLPNWPRGPPMPLPNRPRGSSRLRGLLPSLLHRSGSAHVVHAPPGLPLSGPSDFP
jgi:hypothetical protein